MSLFFLSFFFNLTCRVSITMRTFVPFLGTPRLLALIIPFPDAIDAVSRARKAYCTKERNSTRKSHRALPPCKRRSSGLGLS